MADASLVIVNYRTADATARCLALTEAAAEGLVLERVVVDNASGGDDVARLRERCPEARIVECAENGGFGAGVNAGFAATATPFVVVLNPDTEPAPRSLTLLVEHLRHHPHTGVAGPLLALPDGRPQRSAHKRFPNLLTVFVDFCVPLGWLLARFPERHPHELSEATTARGGAVAHVNGSAMAIRRAAFEEAGPFDEGFFMYLEETEWQHRVRERGWSVDVVGEARVVHETRGGAGMAAIAGRYLPSVYRYQSLRGRSARSVGLVLRTASALSRAALRLRGGDDDLLAFHRAVRDFVRDRR